MFTDKDDKKFYIERPDPNFSPAKNKAVVERSIMKYEAMRKKKQHEYDDAYAERADAVVTYLKSFNKTGEKNIQRYFSPKYLAFLRGDEIRKELYSRMKIYNNKGELITLNI